jgi:hypothetical protein
MTEHDLSLPVVGNFFLIRGYWPHPRWFGIACGTILGRALPSPKLFASKCHEQGKFELLAVVRLQKHFYTFGGECRKTDSNQLESSSWEVAPSFLETFMPRWQVGNVS